MNVISKVFTSINDARLAYLSFFLGEGRYENSFSNRNLWVRGMFFRWFAYDYPLLVVAFLFIPFDYLYDTWLFFQLRELYSFFFWNLDSFYYAKDYKYLTSLVVFTQLFSLAFIWCPFVCVSIELDDINILAKRGFEFKPFLIFALPFIMMVMFFAGVELPFGYLSIIECLDCSSENRFFSIATQLFGIFLFYWFFTVWVLFVKYFLFLKK